MKDRNGEQITRKTDLVKLKNQIYTEEMELSEGGSYDEVFRAGWNACAEYSEVADRVSYLSDLYEVTIQVVWSQVGI